MFESHSHLFSWASLDEPANLRKCLSVEPEASELKTLMLQDERLAFCFCRGFLFGFWWQRPLMIPFLTYPTASRPAFIFVPGLYTFFIRQTCNYHDCIMYSLNFHSYSWPKMTK